MIQETVDFENRRTRNPAFFYDFSFQSIQFSSPFSIYAHHYIACDFLKIKKPRFSPRQNLPCLKQHDKKIRITLNKDSIHRSQALIGGLVETYGPYLQDYTRCFIKLVFILSYDQINDKSLKSNLFD